MTDLILDFFKNLPIGNLDLLSVAITVAAIVILGVVIYINNPKSATNRSFLYLSSSAALWSIVNYLSYGLHIQDNLGLWLYRGVLFSATWFAFNVFRLAYLFPKEEENLPRIYNTTILPVTFFTSILALSPLIFKGFISSTSAGEVAKIDIRPGIFVFAVVAVLLNVGGIIIFHKRYLGAKGNEKKSYRLVLIGLYITISLILIFNFILPAFYQVLTFIPLGALFVFPFIAFTSYSILKHKLFNVKVAATGLLIFALAVVTFFEIIFADTMSQILFRSGIFLLVLLTGILLIRSVFREVEQREKNERLAKDLQVSSDKLFVANEKLKELDVKKTEFVSMAAHQLRAPLTAIKGYSSMLLEGSFGPIEQKAKDKIQVVFESSNRLNTVIEDFLNVTRIELGKMKYEMSEFDFSQLVKQVTSELHQVAERKNMSLALMIPPEVNYKVTGDYGKLAQVIGNLIDNAIKYSDRGPIIVKLERIDNKVVFSVKDNGVGISKETMEQLFKKFSRADNASKANATGTGLGLYVAKEIVDAHHGRIWAESAGPGMGSTFFVEI